MCGGKSLSLGSNLFGLPDPVQQMTGNVKQPKVTTVEEQEAVLQKKLEQEKALADRAVLLGKKSQAEKDKEDAKRAMRTLLGAPVDPTAAARWKPTPGLFGVAKIPLFKGVKTPTPVANQPFQEYSDYMASQAELRRRDYYRADLT